MEQDIKLMLTISNQRPVELTDLTLSLNSLADEYRRFLAVKESTVDADNIKLYIHEIRTGSIVTYLQAMAPYALPLVEHSETIVGYAKHLKSWYDFLAGGAERRVTPEDRQTLQNLSNILEPVAKDRGSQVNIGVVNVQGDVHMNVTVGSLESNAAQNLAKRELEKLKEPVSGLHEKVLMYWHQARNEIGGKTGDRAIIELIHKGAVKTIFAGDDIKAAMLYDEPHPFSKGFVVDVVAQTVDDKPVLYKVTHLHEAFDIER